MKQQAPHSGSRALTKKPALAVITTGDGPHPVADPVPAAVREDRIRQTAYAHYEARGRTDGHALEDWLSAEAEVDGTPPASSPPSH